MQEKLKIYDLDDLRSSLDRGEIISAIRSAYVQHWQGEVISPVPGQLLFDEPSGDCHIKYGYVRGGDVFVIKVAMGFYQNPKHGLSVNNGLVLVFDAKTGKTRAVLQDEGWLTSWRTAAAGALAAKAGAPSTITRIGIFGAGHQAEQQAIWVSEMLNCPDITIWGKFPHEADALAVKLNAQSLNVLAVQNVEDLLNTCNVIITCTPSTAALFPASGVRKGTHIVALGADSPGKQELDPVLFARAAVIATDDHAQCIDHGDYGNAVRLGIIDACVDISLGKILAGAALGRLSDDDITIVDLTGLPVLDIAIGSLAIKNLERAIEIAQNSQIVI